MADKIKYYDIKKTLKTDVPYYVIIGKRSNGKTYSTLKYCIEQFMKEGKQCVYLRRYREDIIGARGQKVFSDFMDKPDFIRKLSKGRYEGLHYWNRCLYACTFDEKTNKPIYSENDRICYFMCLSDVEHDKSTGGYSDVSTIVFDEFIARQGYITDEFINFTNVVSTIVRGKTDVKVIMLGNTISKFCPYFKEMGLKHIERMKQGTIDIYEYGDSNLKVLVEYTADNTGNRASDFYFAFDNPKLSMITKGVWELPVYPHCSVSFTEKNVVFRYYIMFSEKTFECQVVSKDDNMFTFIFEKTTAISDKEQHLVYQLDSLENKYYSSNIFHYRNETERKILWFYTHEKVFYSNNEVGNYIQNYLKECKK